MRRAALVGLALLTACAPAPHKIAAAYVQEAPYAAMSCDELAAEFTKVHASIRDIGKRQEMKANIDWAGVALLGFPVSGMTGTDYEPAIAYGKGVIMVIDRLRTDRACPPVAG